MDRNIAANETTNSILKLEELEGRMQDFSFRNKLINYKYGSSAIRLTGISLDELYGRLTGACAGGTEFKRPVKPAGDPRIGAAVSLIGNVEAPLDITAGDIGYEVSFAEAKKLLKGIRAKARLALEEQGANVLYVSFGFIEWTDDEKKVTVKSPLVLVPVNLMHAKLNAPYVLTLREDEDIVVNPTLACYFKKQKNIQLPAFNPEQEALSDYFDKIKNYDSPDGGVSWRFCEEMGLGLLSFKKIAMYNDMQNFRQQIQAHGIFRILSGDEPGMQKAGEEINVIDLDSIPSSELFHVLDADASQMKAILGSKLGLSFVLNGPPGTGKSQTIANIIAQALADGKKILFVSEKMAALEVVEKRLSEVGLSDFALMLHNSKANKSSIISEIASNLGLTDGQVNVSGLDSLEKLDHRKKQLKRYLSELHSKEYGNNRSFYRVFTLLEENSIGSVVEYTPGKEPWSVTENELSEQIDVIRKYASAASSMKAPPKDSPWQQLGEVSSIVNTRQLREDITRLREYLDNCSGIFSELFGSEEQCSGVGFAHIGEFARLAADTAALPSVPKSWITSFDEEKLYAILEKAQEVRKGIALTERSADGVFDDGFASESAEIAEQYIRAKETAESIGMSPESLREFAVNPEAARARLAEMESNLDKYQKLIDSVNDLFGTSFSVSAADARRAIYIIDTAKQHRVDSSWFDMADYEMLRSMIASVRPHAEVLAELEAYVCGKWKPEVFMTDADPEAMRAAFERTRSMSPSEKLCDAERSRYAEELAKYCCPGFTANDDVKIELTARIKRYKEVYPSFAPLAGILKEQTGSLWNGASTDWNAVTDGLDYIEKLRAMLGGDIPEKVRGFIISGNASALAGTRFELDMMLKCFGDTEIPLDTAASSGSQYIPQRIISSYIALELLDSCMERASHFLRNPMESRGGIYDAIEALAMHGTVSEELASVTELIRKVFSGIETAELGAGADLKKLAAVIDGYSRVKNSEYFGLVEGLACLDPEKKKAAAEKTAQLTRLADSMAGFAQGIARLCEQFAEDDEFVRAITGGSIGDVRTAFEKYSDISGIESYLNRNAAMEEAQEKNIGDFLERVEESGINENLVESYIKSFCLRWLAGERDKTESVKHFSRAGQENIISEFARLDKLRHTTARDRIRKAVISRIAKENGDFQGLDEETRTLIRAKESSGKGITLRRLFEKIPNCLLKLKPCLMMSPLSVANLLDANKYSFDLVIFDEASQIFPEDAIGSIFRGSQVIIAGDDQQLPPADFFAASALGDAGDYDTDTAEDVPIEKSILEEFLIYFPKLTLNTHYRSADEALIDFSNVHFYDGKLETFPASRRCTPHMGVEFEYVPDGKYVNKKNAKEAERCVQLVEQHIRLYPERSLGIIAFSEAQQEEIENAVSDFREAHPEYESFFELHERSQTPFFVKNLENVQGDERDTVIFSICYAKGEDGRFVMNFGPLTRAGGEKRLNVAITRARLNIKVVSSVLPEDFSLNENSAVGNKCLCSYIRYARSCGRLSAGEKLDTGREPLPDEFRDAIAAFIERNGYRVTKNVGRSGSYRVDIAVESPYVEGQYIAAIECDGAYYSNAKTTKDREITRPGMLEKMGWSLYRVWSAAWNDNNELERRALLDFIHKAARKSLPETEGSSTEQEGTDSKVMPSATGSKGASPTPEKAEDTVPDTAPSGKNDTDSGVPAEKMPGTSDADSTNSCPFEEYYNPYGFMNYTRAVYDTAVDFDNPEGEKVAAARLFETLCFEQPIHIDLLTERTAKFCGRSAGDTAVTDFVENTLINIIANHAAIDAEGFAVTGFAVPSRARVPGRPEDRRKIEHIACSEIAAAVKGVLRSTGSFDIEALCGECSALFGYSRENAELCLKVRGVIAALTDCGELSMAPDGAVRLADDRAK